MDVGAVAQGTGLAHGVADTLSQWSLPTILVFAAGGGAFGGAAELLGRLRLRDGQFHLIDERLTGWIFLLALLIQAVIGICGAAAVVFVFASTTWFPHDDTTQSRLWLLTLSVVAGFGSRRFLPMVTRRLERQVQELEEKVSEERKEIRVQETRSMIQDIVSRAMVLLGRDSKATPTEMNTSLMELRELLRSHPKERVATIVAGRILRRLGELDEGIKVHTAYLDEKSKSAEKDLDYADVLYNRACYRCIMWSQNQVGSFKEEGLRDLEESVRYNPQNARGAAEDEDFKPWWADSEFKRITTQSA